MAFFCWICVRSACHINVLLEGFLGAGNPGGKGDVGKQLRQEQIPPHSPGAAGAHGSIQSIPDREVLAVEIEAKPSRSA